MLHTCTSERGYWQSENSPDAEKRFGENLQVELVSGTDFPDDLTEYDLIIQCGACMFNRKYVMYRIDRAKKQQVPVTNYGITIAHLTGILDHVALPE